MPSDAAVFASISMTMVANVVLVAPPLEAQPESHPRRIAFRG